MRARAWAVVTVASFFGLVAAFVGFLVSGLGDDRYAGAGVPLGGWVAFAAAGVCFCAAAVGFVLWYVLGAENG